MSVEAITWALAQSLDRSSTKFVLVAIANCANSDGLCWPSVAYLSGATAQNRKTVLENLKMLRERGYISDTGERRGITGSVIVYRLNSPKNGTSSVAQVVPKTELLSNTEIGTCPENGTGEAVPKTDWKQSQKRTGSSPKNGTRNRKGTVKEPSVPLAQSFARFWQSYPKRKSKGQAEKAWQKLKPNEQLMQAILAGVEQAKTSEQWQRDGGQFIPYPATWLNAKGWEDDDGAVCVGEWAKGAI